jgi:hypothetical protein
MKSRLAKPHEPYRRSPITHELLLHRMVDAAAARSVTFELASSV